MKLIDILNANPNNWHLDSIGTLLLTAIKDAIKGILERTDDLFCRKEYADSKFCTKMHIDYVEEHIANQIRALDNSSTIESLMNKIDKLETVNKILIGYLSSPISTRIKPIKFEELLQSEIDQQIQERYYSYD